MKTRLSLKLVGGAIYAFMLLPLILVVWLSFSGSTFLSIPPDGYSLQWYQGLPGETKLFGGLIYSITLAAIAMVISVAIGAMAAIAIGRGSVRFASWIENALILPLVIPTIVTGIAVYIYLYNVSLIINQQLVPTTLALLLAHVLITLPWTFRLIYAGTIGIRGDLERASLDLGRPPLQTILRITIPLLRPAIMGAAIFSFIFSFGNLEISLFLVRPGETTLPVAMVQYAEFRVDPTLAAISTVQILLIGFLLLVGSYFVRIRDVFSSGRRR